MVVIFVCLTLWIRSVFIIEINVEVVIIGSLRSVKHNVMLALGI
jgi:hypothetical protein